MLESVLYDTRLPESYALISAYTALIAPKIPSSRFSYVVNSTDILTNRVSGDHFVMQKKLIQSKLRLDKNFEANFIEHGGVFAEFDILKFKGTALVVNTFIIDSYISTGIYACQLYDFELYYVDSIPLDCAFFEYMLITNQNLTLHNSLPDMAEATSSTNAIMKLVKARLAPKC